MSRLLRSGELLEPPYFDFMQDVVAILRTHRQHLLQLEPAFYQDFACNSCAECCQRPWEIAIDRAYYDQWYTRLDQEPSGRYRQPFVLRAEGSETHYADIRRKPGTGECLFLMDDRRCFVQASFGAAALNRTCQVYPRYEGWFGAFLGKFMVQSCPEVVRLNQAFPQVRYTVGIASAEQMAVFEAKRHPLGLLEGYLWLGLQLDLLQAAPTPVQALRRLRTLLQAHAAGENLTEAAMQRLQPWLVRVSGESLPAGGRSELHFDCLDWTLSAYAGIRDYLAEVRQGRRALPRLNAAERQLLNVFLGHYLAYRLLTINFYEQNQLLLFFPAYLLLSINLALVNWVALYYREREGVALNQEHLLRAARLVSYRYEHASPLLEVLARMNPTACLESMESLLIHDFGADDGN